MDFIKEQWQGLAPKDRSALTIGGCVALLLLLFTEVISPVYEYRDKAIQQREYWHNAHAYLKGNEAQARQVAINQTATDQTQTTESVRITVSQLADKNRISLSRIEPSLDSVAVWVDETDFKSGLSWLQSITKQQKIKIKSLNVTKLKSNGKVGIRAEFYL